ncbi:uncharacterized protein V1510DRAFT_430779 [Dipodascopsis tothii]|uniref:uncharacterized protein n=1 Tax=Dipodascopsis tothii TaxID=44089 RepID=UPI0034CE38D3
MAGRGFSPMRLAIRLAIYYTLYLALYACPLLGPLTAEAPCGCSVLHRAAAPVLEAAAPHVRARLGPLAERAAPYVSASIAKYQTQVAPQVARAGTWAVDRYTGSALEAKVASGRAAVAERYRAKAEPRLAAVREQYATHVAPGVRAVSGRAGAVYEQQVLPAYERTAPLVQRGVEQSRRVLAERVLPASAAAFEVSRAGALRHYARAVEFYVTSVGPRLREFYRAHVEPPLARTYDHLFRKADVAVGDDAPVPADAPAVADMRDDAFAAELLEPETALADEVMNGDAATSAATSAGEAVPAAAEAKAEAEAEALPPATAEDATTVALGAEPVLVDAEPVLEDVPVVPGLPAMGAMPDAPEAVEAEAAAQTAAAEEAAEDLEPLETAGLASGLTTPEPAATPAPVDPEEPGAVADDGAEPAEPADMVDAVETIEADVASAGSAVVNTVAATPAPDGDAAVTAEIAADVAQWTDKFRSAGKQAVTNLNAELEDLTNGVLAQLAGAAADLARARSEVEPTLISSSEREQGADLADGLGRPEAAQLAADTSAAIVARTHALVDEFHAQAGDVRTGVLEVFNSVTEVGLRELGHKWAWMDGVTWRDWKEFQHLRKMATEFGDVIMGIPVTAAAVDTAAADVERDALAWAADVRDGAAAVEAAADDDDVDDEDAEPATITVVRTLTSTQVTEIWESDAPTEPEYVIQTSPPEPVDEYVIQTSPPEPDADYYERHPGPA